MYSVRWPSKLESLESSFPIEFKLDELPSKLGAFPVMRLSISSKSFLHFSPLAPRLSLSLRSISHLFSSHEEWSITSIDGAFAAFNINRLLYICYASRYIFHPPRTAMINVHRVVVSVQPQGDDRRRRRGDDGRDGRIVIPVVVAADADRLPASEDARAAKQNGVRDRVLGRSARRYFADDGTVLLLHLDRMQRAGSEDHPATPRRWYRSSILDRGRVTRFSPAGLTVGERDVMV